MSSDLEPEQPRELDALRASLRLCFSPGDADRLAALIDHHAVDVASLAPLLRIARLRYTVDRVRRLRRRWGGPTLGPRRGISGRAAIFLALHLGLGLSTAELARVTGQTEEQIGRDLLAARHVVDPQVAAPCEEFAAQIGRYRERSFDRDDALAFLLHRETCERCRRVLDDVRRVDERLLAELVEFHLSLDPLNRLPSRAVSLLALPALVVATLAVAGFVLVAGALIGGPRPRSAPSQSNPLSASTASTANSGWLLETSSAGDVAALNVASGEWRTLVPAPVIGTATVLISPTGQRMAQTVSSPTTELPDKLRIYDLSGTLRHEWPLEDTQHVLLPLSWLNDSSILMSQIPTSLFHTSFDKFSATTDEQGALVLFDVDTGVQRTIFDHGVRMATPSPDGRFIAVSRYSTQSVREVELRAFDGHVLGPAIGTFDQGGFPIFWSNDSQGLYFTASHLLEVTPVPRDLGDRGLSGQPGFSYSIDRMTANGSTEQLIEFPRGVTGNALGVSPDGTRFVYVRDSNTLSGSDWGLWQSAVDGSHEVRLASTIAGLGGENVVWSGTGDAFLVSTEPFYLPQSASIPTESGPTSFQTLMLDIRGNIRATMADQLHEPTLLGFAPELPANARASTGSRSDAAFGSPQTISGLGGHLSLTQASRVSPNGGRLLMYDGATNLSDAVTVDERPSADVVGSGEDLSWLPDGSGVAGVTDIRLQQGGNGRIIVAEAGVGSINGFVEFDPMNLGDTSPQVYREPQFSPDGIHCNFFVEGQRQISLWLSGRGEDVRQIQTWDLPPDARVDPPLIVRWASADTLFVADWQGWTDGYPTRVVLERIRIEPNGQFAVETLATWRFHGGDHGMSILDIALAPGHDVIAVRLRHYTGVQPDVDSYDTVDVLSTADPGSPIELNRGTSGDGVSWSPDGDELAFALDGQIDVASATGSNLQRVPTGSEPGNFPVWVGYDEIWFTAGDGASAITLRLVR